MVIEFAQNVLKIEDAYSQEHESIFSSNNYVITLLPESSAEILGGTMRLGAKKTIIK